MIEVKFRGQTGNQLCQHSYGRLLAESMEYEFQCPPVDGFPELPTNLPGFPESIHTIHLHQDSTCPTVITHETLRQFNGFTITLEGYFERAEFFEPHRAKILGWFPNPPPHASYIAIHVRGGDAKHHSPPLSYYINAMDCLEPWAITDDHGVRLYTDDPSDDVVCELSRRFLATVCHGEPREDFEQMRRAEWLIIGNSTFAWWAAFLSDASVTQPEPAHGFRSAEMPNTYLHVNAWKQIGY